VRVAEHRLDVRDREAPDGHGAEQVPQAVERQAPQAGALDGPAVRTSQQ
jgi:hypothetical protein